MNDNIMKDEIKDAVTEYANGNADQVWVVVHQRGIIKKCYAWKTEYQSDQVIALRPVTVNCMM